MAASILDVPTEVLETITSPECQLRYTCRQLYTHVRPVPFSSIDELRKSAWWSRVVGGGNLRNIFNTCLPGNIVTLSSLAEPSPPYLLLHKCLSLLGGLAIRDCSVLPYLAAIPSYKLFEPVFYGYARTWACPNYDLDGGELTKMIRVSDCGYDAYGVYNYTYGIVNYIDELTINQVQSVRPYVVYRAITK